MNHCPLEYKSRLLLTRQYQGSSEQYHYKNPSFSVFPNSDPLPLITDRTIRFPNSATVPPITDRPIRFPNSATVPPITDRTIRFPNSATVPLITDRTTLFPHSDPTPLEKNLCSCSYLEWKEEGITTERTKLMQEDTETARITSSHSMSLA